MNSPVETTKSAFIDDIGKDTKISPTKVSFKEEPFDETYPIDKTNAIDESEPIVDVDETLKKYFGATKYTTTIITSKVLNDGIGKIKELTKMKNIF